MYFKHFWLAIIVLTLVSCDRPEEVEIRKLSIGVVSYGNTDKSLQQYGEFQKYLGTQQNSLIELEPAYNEVRALQQITNKKWDMVFAPPGLAAIAISQHNYEPLVPLEGRDKNRSIIVVKQNSTAQDLRDLGGQTIALGQKGSAAGYYLPIFNLYGLNFREVLYAPTPQKVLQLLSEGKVAVGALSLGDFNLLKRDYPPNQFKVVYLDQHNVPPGAIIISDRLERNQQEQLSVALKETPSFISSAAGYLPNEPLPDYNYLTKVIKRVQEVLEESPMVLQK
ncbi:MAG: PhnD/SsuA/transferrin family substrate-binding protein [Cyanobacteria bacterium J06621_12]